MFGFVEQESSLERIDKYVRASFGGGCVDGYGRLGLGLST